MKNWNYQNYLFGILFFLKKRSKLLIIVLMGIVIPNIKNIIVYKALNVDKYVYNKNNLK